MIGLFKKKDKKRLGWDDISLSQYVKLRAIDTTKDLGVIDVIDIIYGEDLTHLTLKEFQKEVKKRYDELQFLSTDVEPHLPKKQYMINGHKYNLNLNKITTAQYIDYSNLMKIAKMPDDLHRLIAIFLLPDGEIYGDYDCKVVEDDVLSMPITDALGICFFFNASLAAFLQCFRYYSEKKIMGLKLSKEEKQKMLEPIQKAFNLEFYH